MTAKKICFFGMLMPAAWLLSEVAVAQTTWLDLLKFNGDIRPRYELIKEDGEEDRERARFRVRLGVTAEVNDNVDVTIQLATGGGNPVSTNQNFDDGFSIKDIGIDLAYADWAPKDNLHIFVGKMKNPLHRAGDHALIWDGDFNPEGIALKYESGMFFGTISGFAVEERSNADDSLLFAFQGGVSFEVSNSNKLIGGIGYMDYTNTVGNEPFYNGKGKGNSVDIDGNLAYEYKQVEVFAEYKTKLGDYPLAFFANYVENAKVDDYDTGYAVGAKIGKAGKSGTWEGSVAYQELAADAVIATFTDSDWRGGGTDATGFTIKGKYVLADSWNLGVSLFLNEIEKSAAMQRDYMRLQIDLEFKF